MTDGQGLFQDKVVFVTGAAKGIGLAIARRFFVAGAKVAFNDLTDALLAQALNNLDIESRGRVIGCACDVRDSNGVTNMVTKVVEHWGHIDIAVNNAGIYPSQMVVDMHESEWDSVLDINAKGTFLVSQAIARQMIDRKIRGHIINIASGSYRVARMGSAHYCASKAAVDMFSKVLAMELAPYGIQVNVISPGLILVESMELDQDYIDATLRQIPAGRLGTPEDIAEAVFSLASVRSDYLTGSNISVDGGLSLGRYGIPRS
jgi:3-oxoacyl-[acyl-carrier protein] reductase